MLGLGPGRLVQNALALVKVLALLRLRRRRPLDRSRIDVTHFTGADAPGCLPGMLLALDSGDVQLLGLERRRVPRRGSEGSRRATCRARSRWAPSPWSLVYVAMNVVYLYALDVRAMSTVQVRDRRRRGRGAVRAARGRRADRRQHLHRAREHQRQHLRGSARVLRHGARRLVPARRPRVSIRARTRPRSRSPRRPSGARCSC